MLGLGLLLTSLLLQAVAAALALYMMRLTGRMAAWLLVIGAILTMLVRRFVALAHAGPGGLGLDPWNEGLALIVSAFLVGGIGMLIPVFRRMRDTAEALRQSAGYFRDFFESSRVGIYRTTPDGRIVMANPALVRMMGFPSFEALAARNLEREGFGPQYSRREFRERLEAAGEIRGLEAEWVRSDGAPLFVRENAVVIRDEAGRPLWYTGTIEDVTERRLAEVALRESEERLLAERLRGQKLESIGVLAGGIAHDFNNILTAILGNISLARLQVPPGGSVDGRLEDAERALDRARDLTHQLLTFSKGGAPVKRLSSVADLIRDSARFVLQGSNVRCEFAIADDLRPVEVDPGQISQVIQNLVLNADQAMPEGGEVRIEASNHDAGPDDPLRLQPGRYVRLAVRDQGTGIASENLARVFDPYFSTKAEGSGLGLAICYSVVRNHGGLIRVESEPGRGATFQVFLPAAQGTPGGAGGDDESPLLSGRGGRGRILVVDDQEAILDVVCRMLQVLGCEPVPVRDGAAAIERYRESLGEGRRFQAVLLDLTIPGGLGGLETLRRLQEVDPYVRGIVVSGYSQDPVLSDFRKHGFAAVVAKPFQVRDLERALDEVRSGPGRPAGAEG